MGLLTDTFQIEVVVNVAQVAQRVQSRDTFLAEVAAQLEGQGHAAGAAAAASQGGAEAAARPARLHLPQPGEQSLVLVDALLQTLLRLAQVLLRQLQLLFQRIHLVGLDLELVEVVVPALQQGPQLFGHVPQFVDLRTFALQRFPQLQRLAPHGLRLAANRLQLFLLPLQQDPAFVEIAIN